MPSKQLWKSRFEHWYSKNRLSSADTEEYWSDLSKKFREFWSTKIMPPAYSLTQDDLEEVIRMLDTKARGNTNAKAKAVADLYLRQNMQEDLIKNIKTDKTKKELLNTFFTSKSDAEKVKTINDLQVYEGKNGMPRLTTLYGVFLNALCYAYDPLSHVNIVSLDKEKSAIEYFEIPIEFDLDRCSYGEAIVQSNKAILDFFRNLGINEHTYLIGSFIWAVMSNEEEVGEGFSGTFNLERYLDEFLFKNWEKIRELNKYKMLMKDGEIIGREYRAGTGRIDILARDEDKGTYLVIELKKNQTSDAVAGQLLRYMNWVKGNLAKKNDVKGLIIAGDIDDNLKLSLADRKDVQLMTYEVHFNLQRVID